MNAQQFTQEEQGSYSQALRYGRAYVATLNDYQRARLADLARENQYRAVQVNTERFERQPYDSQEPGQLDYWLSCSTDYMAAQQILALLDEVATAAPETALEAPLMPTLPDATAKPKTASKRSKPAELSKDLKLPAVKEIFSKAGLGANSQPGEWGAALTALSATGYLVGTPPALLRWFEESQIAGKASRRTLQNQRYFTEYQQFNNVAEQEIFKSVKRKVEQLKA